MTARPNAPIACILLVAGGSKRLGRPKQLLLYQGKTLVRRAAETICSTNYSPAVVVLGSRAAEVEAEIADLPIRPVLNDSWEQGLSSSITSGLNYLIQMEPKLSAVLVTLCDQPLISADDLNTFGEKFFASSANVVAAEYGYTVGVPALFSAGLFNDLLTLKGDKGARSLIHEDQSTLLTIPLPAAAIDIDTQADFDRLN
jgi:molybdenum cofactor cytidylyltransferase